MCIYEPSFYQTSSKPFEMAREGANTDNENYSKNEDSNHQQRDL